MSDKIPGPKLRQLKALAQKLEPLLHLGKQGLSEAFLKSVNDGLERRELIKIKFSEFKDQKKTLMPELAEKTGSAIIQQVGNVVVLYRENPDPEKRALRLD